MEDKSGAREESGAANTPREPHGDGEKGIDIHRLADKVYRLAMAEARLARARGERVGPRGEW